MNAADADTRLVRRALAGDLRALRLLVDALTPVVQTRVVRALLRAGGARSQKRDLRQDVADFTQEVFLALFDNNARALRSWDPTRGLSLLNFVGLVADHQVASLLRSGRRNPWTDEPMVCDELDSAAGAADGSDARIHSRDLLLKLLDRLRAELSPRGLLLFQLLAVEERTPSNVCAELGMSADAVYAWKSRLNKLVRRLVDDLEANHELTDPPSRNSGTRRDERRAP
jgi:RNA polymerase sigma-70 factor, ECF subfamily